MGTKKVIKLDEGELTRQQQERAALYAQPSLPPVDLKDVGDLDQIMAGFDDTSTTLVNDWN